jgi:hypothetical protein
MPHLTHPLVFTALILSRKSFICILNYQKTRKGTKKNAYMQEKCENKIFRCKNRLKNTKKRQLAKDAVFLRYFALNNKKQTLCFYQEDTEKMR